MTREAERDPSELFSQSCQKMDPYTPGPSAIDLTPDQDGGLLKEIKVQGSGTSKPTSQDRVTVHYTGYFPNGTVFDSSRDRNDKFEFTLGRGDVIKAWDLGVGSMLRGEVATLYCKSQYAYGEAGSPPKIPPNATLVFEIELFDWKGEDLTKDKDGGIIRSQVSKGSGYVRPKSGATVEVHIIGKYEDRVFDERDVTFVLGEGSAHGIPDGVEKGLEKFQKSERSILTLSSAYAFGTSGKPEYNIPPDATVAYDITLNSFEKAKEMWEMETAEKIEQANIFKTKGTNSFKEENYKTALLYYTKINEYLENEDALANEEQKNECQQLKLAGLLNSAMCQLKLKSYPEAKELCDKVLEVDPLNVKGLFRRAQAYFSMNEYDAAIRDYNAVAPLDPKNKAIANGIIQANNMIKKQNEKDRKTYANMFSKFAAQDEERERRRNANVMENPGTWNEKQSSEEAEASTETISLDNEEISTIKNDEAPMEI